MAASQVTRRRCWNCSTTAATSCKRAPACTSSPSQCERGIVGVSTRVKHTAAVLIRRRPGEEGSRSPCQPTAPWVDSDCSPLSFHCFRYCAAPEMARPTDHHLPGEGHCDCEHHHFILFSQILCYSLIKPMADPRLLRTNHCKALSAMPPRAATRFVGASGANSPHEGRVSRSQRTVQATPRQR